MHAARLPWKHDLIEVPGNVSVIADSSLADGGARASKKPESEKLDGGGIRREQLPQVANGTRLVMIRPAKESRMFLNLIGRLRSLLMSVNLNYH